ncbi:DOPA 4,5-dioxygenase family protein [Vibrio sp. T11.5]|uniref:DOPA 4,5-dioxygenase family protein n=1 Tax=Vibrio sp. T11.5 TaxID=2998836 RepID=UPI0022CD2C5F|nr:DOPA 4,5-dioxygenase family protein [Vibrio sp. T11.5]MDA0120390.1 DOPA 4,5-dioxygenase family protein [Vibrio sp. T11.5]
MTYPKNTHQDYHAHIYFDADSNDFAAQLRERISADLELTVGRFNQKLVGPHTMWSFSVTFTSDDFDVLIPWLDKARGNLSVLVHALTDNDLKDHTEFAYWLGEPVALNLSSF